MSEAMVFIDMFGLKYVICNECGAEYGGLEVDEMIGEPPYEMFEIHCVCDDNKGNCIVYKP